MEKKSPKAEEQKTGQPKSAFRRLLMAACVALTIVIAFAVWMWSPSSTGYTNTPSAETANYEDDPNYKAGEAYLEKVAQEEGVESLGGGIYYKVLIAGNGPKPGAESQVRVNYEGRLVDGTVFDSSYKRGEAATFPLNGVITGWQIALKAMPVGSTWEVYIPYYYAYGERGSGANIPPYSALVFKVELLGIE